MASGQSVSNSIVIGTAGHIDHGKTALVRALTGIDTDRLAEEKKRGISIDLGFAHWHSDDGSRISFIDVPGHERFVKNMLAGASGIDFVLFVVAADSGVQPQTEEHFEICRLLGIKSGVIAITKADLASADRLAETITEVEALVAASFLDSAALVPVSAHTGAGLDHLRRVLLNAAAATRTRDSELIPRLWVDRSFPKQGFGTVVTGTLMSGRLKVGEIVEVLPILKQVRIRGLQVHGASVEEATAGNRTAVNLVGIEHADIARGFVLTRPGIFEMTKRLDVHFEWADRLTASSAAPPGLAPHETAPRQRQAIQLHTGTAEVYGTLKILSQDGTKNVLARVFLRQPILVLPGDHFILRQPSPQQTLGGGVVVDVQPPFRVSREKAVARLKQLATGSVAQRLSLFVAESASGRTLTQLVRLLGLPAERLLPAIEADMSLWLAKAEGRVLSTQWIAVKQKAVLAAVEKHHREQPVSAGVALAQLRDQLFPGVEISIVDGLLKTTPGLAVRGETVALASHSISLAPQEAEALAKIEHAFRAGAFTPPELPAVLALVTIGPKRARDLFESLVKAKRLVRIGGDLVFHAEVIEHLRKSLAAHKGRRFTVPEFKEWTQISRKFAIPLLEHLDRERITRRDGDARVVL
jgi:selenocysteine-specific elongation factor